MLKNKRVAPRISLVLALFSAPTLESFRTLPETQQQAFIASYGRLSHPDFVSTGPAKLPSYYVTPEGRVELRQVARMILKLSKEHHYRAIYSIGRSGTGIMAYLIGLGENVRDLPFSWRGVRWAVMTGGKRAALRVHLKALGLSPKEIASAERPILLYDNVYSGTGVTTLLEEIYIWAHEVGLADEVKAKLHFLGFFPPWMIAERSLRELHRAALRERLNSAAPPSTDDIDKAARAVSLPGEHKLARYASRVFSMRISTAFFEYATLYGPNVQESFIPDKWEAAVNSQAESAKFLGQLEEPAFVELHYLISEGIKDSRRKTCADVHSFQLH
ncbi:MAG: hypothetical protein C5B49_00465 [Bdellovibrio sp.]|nr:MAG: hypothetical protein C5B49_00465 [Bdellovibrio sp.]